MNEHVEANAIARRYPDYSSLHPQPPVSMFDDQNQLAFRSNLNLEFMTENIGEYSLIISNNTIFTPSFMEAIRDLASSIRTTTIQGNTVTNLVINTELANSYLDEYIQYSNSLASGVTGGSGRGDIEYENAVRNIRNNPVTIISPELRELMGETFRGGSFSILEVSPSSISTTSTYIEESLNSYTNSPNSMRMAYRERLQILFSCQNPGIGTLPSWSEVPSRPSEP